jgi:hypothetical protein
MRLFTNNNNVWITFFYKAILIVFVEMPKRNRPPSRQWCIKGWNEFGLIEQTVKNSIRFNRAYHTCQAYCTTYIEALVSALINKLPYQKSRLHEGL